MARPKTAPKPLDPKPGRKVIDLTQKNRLASLGRSVKENWEHCLPKYWVTRPDDRYYFLVEHLQLMEKRMTQEEWQAFITRRHESGSTLIAANHIRAPYALCKWIWKRHLTAIKKADKALEKQEVAGIVERLRKMQSTSLKELEKRIRNPESLGADEVLRIFSGVSKVMQEFETNKSDLGSLDMKVIMGVPLSSREAGALEGLDPTLEEVS